MIPGHSFTKTKHLCQFVIRLNSRIALIFTVSFDDNEFKKSVFGENGSERVINGLKNGFRILKPKTGTS